MKIRILLVVLYIVLFSIYGLGSNICFAENLRTFQGVVKDNSTKNQFLKFLDRNLGKTVEFNLSIPNNNPHIRVAIKGTDYEDADDILFWDFDCKNPSSNPCVGDSLFIRGNGHRLTQRDAMFILSGTFKIGKNTEMHQGVKVYGLTSRSTGRTNARR